MGAKACPKCGKKFGALFDPAIKPSDSDINYALRYGIYKDGLCDECLGAIIKKHEGELAEIPPEDQIIKKETGYDWEVIKKVFLSPAQIPDTFDDLGLVTGYCILGTGPWSELVSSWTDFFGEKSSAYLKKLEEAEKYALIMMRVKALNLGVRHIYNVHINLSEATSGHGMIMVSTYGSAAKER